MTATESLVPELALDAVPQLSVPELALPELALRAVVLYVPLLATVGLALRHGRDRRRLTAALLATAWNVPALLAVNALAQRAGWWSFGSDDVTVAGLPVDLWLGWALLWGAVPVLAAADHWVLAALLLVDVDLAVMPLLDPVVQLGDRWLVGEVVAVAAALVPGLLLGAWTADDRHVPARAGLQAVAFGALVLYVVPSLAFATTGGGWDALSDRTVAQLAVAGAVAGPVALAALAAVVVFARDGGGTPVPLDPPRRLVTSGPYAYVANPMQIGGAVVLVVWGALLASPAVVGAAAVATAFSAGMAAWLEDGELERRFGPEWRAYRSQVRLWLPRLRPYRPDRRVSRPCAGRSRRGACRVARRPGRPAARRARP